MARARRRSSRQGAAGDAPREGRAGRLFKQAAAGVAFVSSVAGLLFLFAPGLRPGDDPPPQPPAEQFAQLSGIVLDATTTKGQFLDRADLPKQGFTPAQLRARGAFAQFSVEIVGFTGKPVTLQRELVDGRTGDEIGQIRSDTITPPGPRVRSPWRDWVALRPGTGSYVLVFKLVDAPRSLTLDCIQSEPFGGLDGLAPGRPLRLCADD
jgi:hypothetical protein